MPTQFRGILFDLDETLHSREGAFWSWIDEQVAMTGVAADKQIIAQLDNRGRGDKQRLLAHLNDLFRWRLASAERREHFRTGVARHFRPFPGLFELLSELRRQYRLGLVTNGTSSMQRTKIQRLGIETSFDPIVVSEEVGFKKPDPRIYHLALATWNEPPESVLFVGDDPVLDIEGARAVGMRVVQVGEGGEIPSVLDLWDWIRRWQR